MALHEQYFKRTADNLPAAQYYDSELDELIPQRGKDGAIYVSSIKSSSKTDTLQNAAAANGNGTPQDVEGYASAAVQVSGTFSATISFEGSVDGINYVPLLVLDQTGSPVTSTTAPGIYRVDCAGLKAMRTPITNRVSGAVTVVSRLLPEARPTNLGVQLSGSYATLGVEHNEARFSQSIAAGASITPVSIAKPIAIQGLSIYTNGTLVDKMFVVPSIRKADGTWQVVGSYGWGSGIRLDAPYAAGHHLFEAYKWDTSGKNYTIGLRSAVAPLVCSFGFQLKIDNYDTVERSVVVQINYRQLEV